MGYMAKGARGKSIVLERNILRLKDVHGVKFLIPFLLRFFLTHVNPFKMKKEATTPVAGLSVLYARQTIF